MAASVLDTNVLVIANNRQGEDVECVVACVGELERSKADMIVLDDAFRILNEYRDNVHESGQPGAGDAFLKWLFQNMWVKDRCEQVHISEHPVRSFEEFPDSADFIKFDKSDRKFVTVALASANNPDIVIAADYDDWQPFRMALTRFGVRLNFPCLDGIA